MYSDLWGVMKEDDARAIQKCFSIVKELQNTQDRLLGSFKKKILCIISQSKQGNLSNLFPLLLIANICPKAKVV